MWQEDFFLSTIKAFFCSSRENINMWDNRSDRIRACLGWVRPTTVRSILLGRTLRINGHYLPIFRQPKQRECNRLPTPTAFYFVVTRARRPDQGLICRVLSNLGKGTTLSSDWPVFPDISEAYILKWIMFVSGFRINECWLHTAAQRGLW